MIFKLAVSPDFSPNRIPGWFVFNTWLQRRLDIAMRFEMHDSFAEQRTAIEEDRVDLIYANPYDAAMLVREKGFLPLAKPAGISNEVVVATLAESDVQKLDDLKPGITIATVDGPDVQQTGLIILESADINAENSTLCTYGSNALVAKALLQGGAQVGVFLERSYNELSGLTRKALRPLVVSQIDVITHQLLVGPRFKDHHETLLAALLEMSVNKKDQAILEDLDISGWEQTSLEDIEFLIDIIDTLVE